MSDQPFMQLYVADYLGDTRHLTTEQHGAYLLLLMTMWRHGGHLPNDAGKLARIAGMSARRWHLMSAEVMEFFTVEGESITQKRLVEEYQKAVLKSEKRSASGKLGGDAKALKDKQVAMANASDLPCHSSEPEPDSKKDIAPNGARGTTARNEEREAFDHWNHVAAELGLPKAEKLTDGRRRSLRARIADAGGLDGWKQALDRIASSSFLTGRKTDFRADFDFVLQAKSFTKLSEGAYDDTKPKVVPLFGIAAVKAQDAPHGRDERGVPLTDRGYPVDRDPWAFVH